MKQVALEELEICVCRALEAHGAHAFAAAEVARAVRFAEARSNRVCGLHYVESYCQQLLSGRVRGDVEPEVTQPRSSAVTVDALFGFAQPAFSYGLPHALAAARNNGVATMAVAHAHTCTALGYFTEQIARAGLVGIGFTNAAPIVAAPGGHHPVIGPNPIAFSVPDGEGRIALQFDQSTTMVARDQIAAAKAAGRPIPPEWALDSEGRPATDPEAALAGSLASAGGYKGWGFGLMAEVLAAVMTGSLLSHDVRPLKAPEGTPHDLGQFYIVVDPSVAPDFAGQMRRLAEIVAEDEGAQLPGQHLQETDPVAVPDALWAQVTALAARIPA